MTKKTIDVLDSSYQPNRKELQEDLRLKGTFEQAVKALVQPVELRKAMSRKKSR